MRLVGLGVAVSCATFVLSASPAAAFGQFMGAVPHGSTIGCSACHVSRGGGEGWNPFGQAILVAGGAQPDVNTDDQNDGFDLDSSDFWTIVCRDDSDDDGYTNGEELGDPECTWAAGDDDPADFTPSNPGDADDAPGLPPGGEGEGEGEGDAVDEELGCGATGAQGSTWGALAGLALVLARRRRR